MASLGNDLATIRKEQNLTLDDIHETTKIPKHIISAIEDDSIFSDYEENPTYIRSYVRGYAKVLSIEERDIIYALNKQEKGNYSGSLQKDSEGLPDKTSEHEKESEKESKEEQKKSNNEIVHDQSPDLGPKEKEPESTEPKSSGPVNQPPEVKSVDWADMGRRFQPLKSTKPKLWIGVVAILLIAAIGIAFYFYQSNGKDSSQSKSVTGTTANEQSQAYTGSSDSLQLNLAPPAAQDSINLAGKTGDSTNAQQQIRTQKLDALPDTLSLVVYAAYGKLEPVRIYTDIMDNINPYWIEKGSALRFDFINEVHIRGQYSRMVLMLNGHLIQNFREQFYNPETRLLEIHRSFFEQDPKWLQPAPDSLGIDAPPPSVIKKRPTFN
ncbi:MAG TPA: helix-turn-helix domain-containing protein [Balneolaceae bacterium]|nr:helix-turn-helix domain-containing protein [Balneolaceae bacterium]